MYSKYGEDNISQEFRRKDIEEVKNYFIKVIDQNEFLRKKHGKGFTTLSYTEHFLILVSAIIGCLSIFAFAFLVGTSIGIASSAIKLKICVITTAVKKYQPIIKRKKQKHDKIVFLAKAKLNRIEVLISKMLNYSYISHDEFVLVNDVLNEYNDMKEEIKNSKTSSLNQNF